MSIFPTTVQDFTDALIAALKARDALKDVIVSDGRPTPAGAAGKEFIAVLDTKGAEVARALGRARPTDEHYATDVLFWSSANTKEQSPVTARTYELFAELNDLLNEDRTLASTYAGAGRIVGAVIGEYELRKASKEQRREAGLLVTVNVHGRL